MTDFAFIEILRSTSKIGKQVSRFGERNTLSCYATHYRVTKENARNIDICLET